MKNKFLQVLIIGFVVISCKQKQVVQPQKKDIIDAVFASGKIISDDEYQVTSIIEGYLTSILISEGDTVKKGQPLFNLLNDIQQTQLNNAAINYQFAKESQNNQGPQLLQIEEKIKQARQKMQTDSINVFRYQKLLQSQAVAKVDYDKLFLEYQNDQSSITLLQNEWNQLKRNLSLNAINAKAQLQLQNQNNQYFTLSSETDGQVLNVFKKSGDLVKKGETIGKIGSGNLLAKLYVAEDDIKNIKIGQLVLINLNTEKDTVYRTTVSKIYPSFDESSQSFIVEAAFSSNLINLKIGTQMQANFIINEKKDALVIPSNYLFGGDSVQLSTNKAKIKVKIGIKTLEWTEILGGITESDLLETPYLP